jgi:anti-anti-sigma factor
VASALTFAVGPRGQRVPHDAKASGYGDSVFQVQETSRPGWVRVAVTGALDESTALTFRRRLRALKASNTGVYLDLSEVEFIDSAGADVVLDAIAESRQGTWRVEVERNVSDQARRYFDSIRAWDWPPTSKAARG